MTDPVAVVTGAAMGIGLGIARRFRSGGYTVIGIDRDADTLAELANDQTLVPLAGDVADPDTHDRAAALATEHGRLEVWVNNAGIVRPGSIHEVDRADVDSTLAVNLGGTFWGTAAAVRTMLAAGTPGAIVNVTSTQAFRGFPEQPAYAASKGGIVALTRQVAAEYAPSGIRCNAVAPGVILTPLNQSILDASDDPEGLRAGWAALCPIGREGTPEDVAEAAWYLGTRHSGFVTGQVLTVDGGQTALPPGRAL